LERHAFASRRAALAPNHHKSVVPTETQIVDDHPLIGRSKRRMIVWRQMR
jgi:hypothetical protein